MGSVRNPERCPADRDGSGWAHLVAAEASDAQPIVDADEVRSTFPFEPERVGGAYFDAGAAADAWFCVEDGPKADEGTRKCSETVRNRYEPSAHLAAAVGQ